MSRIYALLIALISSKGILGFTEDANIADSATIRSDGVTKYEDADHVRDTIKKLKIFGHSTREKPEGPDRVTYFPNESMDSGFDTSTQSESTTFISDQSAIDLYGSTVHDVTTTVPKLVSNKYSNENFRNSADQTDDGSGRTFYNSGGHSVRTSEDSIEDGTKNIKTTYPTTDSRGENENVVSATGNQVRSQSLIVPLPEKVKISVEREQNPTTETIDTTMDLLDEEIKQVINSFPKLPEAIFSDNKAHLNFHEDPEETTLDERISQVARQLAETTLRHENEQKKLGHYIPIRLRYYDEDSLINYMSTFPPSRKLSTGRSFNIVSERTKQPPLLFKSLPLSQRIYNKRLDLPVRSGRILSRTKEKLYSTESYHPGEDDDATRHDTNTQMNLALGIQTVVQPSRLYSLPSSTLVLSRNRTPLFFKFSEPEELGSSHNQQLDINPLRGD